MVHTCCICPTIIYLAGDVRNIHFFPTCQVRVVRFYVSCLLLSSSPPLLLSSSPPLLSSPRLLSSPPPPAQPRPSTHSVLCRTSTTTIHSSVPCRTSTTTISAQCSLPDLNHDHPRSVFPAGPQPRVSTPSVPCRTSTTTIHAQCSLPDLNREYPCQVFPAGPHVGRYGTKNVRKKVRKNVRQICYILFANSRVCGRVPRAMPLLTLQVAKFEAISLNR